MSIKVDNRVHFGLSIFSAEISDLANKRLELKQLLINMREQNSQGVARSNQKGWHSQDDLHASQQPLLKWLSQQIYQVSSQMMLHADQSLQADDIQLTSLWANINDTGAWNAPHSHMPCEWSGCIYIDVNENSQEQNASQQGEITPGDIMFFNPMPLGPQYRSPTTINYSPKNCQMFLFPGHLVHMVAPHYDKESRISMAFNFRLKESQT